MGTTPFVILLPPSEGKATGGNVQKPWSGELGVFGSALADYRSVVADQLKAAKGGDQKMLGVKGLHLAHAQAQNRALIGSPTLPAWQRYTGVVWDHLDLASFPGASRTKMVKRIFVPSGLAGIVRGDDLLPDYRLKMGARLAPFGLMSTWWRDDLTDAFASRVGKTPVIDLLPNEHKAAFNWEHIPTVIRVDLVSKKGAVVGGHNAKAAKGLLAKHLFSSGTTSLAKTLSSFSHSDYIAKEST
jgi:hypothetical protein